MNRFPSYATSLGALFLTIALWTGCDRSPTDTDKQNSIGAQASGGKHPVKDPAILDPLPADTTYPLHCGTPDPMDPAVDPIPGIDPVDPNPGVDPLPQNPTCSDPVPDVAVKCTNESHPVCGCDGITYTNGCQALGVGHVNVAYAGACQHGIK